VRQIAWRDLWGANLIPRFEGPRTVMASAPRRMPARSRVPADRKSVLVVRTAAR